MRLCAMQALAVHIQSNQHLIRQECMHKPESSEIHRCKVWRCSAAYKFWNDCGAELWEHFITLGLRVRRIRAVLCVS